MLKVTKENYILETLGSMLIAMITGYLAMYVYGSLKMELVQNKVLTFVLILVFLKYLVLTAKYLFLSLCDEFHTKRKKKNALKNKEEALKNKENV